MIFADREDAGRQLGARLGHLRAEQAVVLGLPRGGVLVAFQVARALRAPLDVIVVRKLGVPVQPELAMGAVGEGGVRVIDREIVDEARVPEQELAAVEAREQAAVEVRAARYRASWPRQPLHDRVAVVVDDGVATGSTARAACRVARAHGAARVVLAVPVAPPGWQERIGGDADELVCVSTPAGFLAIGQFYATFPQVPDGEVIDCLRQQMRTRALQGENYSCPHLRLPVRCRYSGGTAPHGSPPPCWLARLTEPPPVRTESPVPPFLIFARRGVVQAQEPPPSEPMIALLGGFLASQALYVVAALGVADQLVAGPATVEALAGQVGAYPPSLARLLRTLASVGVFTEPEPGLFALTPLGRTLAAGQPGSVRDVAIMLMETHYAAAGGLLHAIRTGQPAAERYYGKPFFDWLADQPEQAGRFTAAMANLAGGLTSAAVAALPLEDAQAIVDIGGADGTMLAAILAAHPHLRGVLFDLPHVIADAPGTLARLGAQDRVECVGGDFFESVPSGGDAYLLSAILHDWPDDQAGRILANVAAAAGGGARLLLVEFVVPPGDVPHPSKFSDLNLLAMTRGKERAEAEWRELLTATGFTGIEVRPTGTPFSVIQATVSSRP